MTNLNYHGSENMKISEEHQNRINDLKKIREIKEGL